MDVSFRTKRRKKWMPVLFICLLQSTASISLNKVQADFETSLVQLKQEIRLAGKSMQQLRTGVKDDSDDIMAYSANLVSDDAQPAAENKTV